MLVLETRNVHSVLPDGIYNLYKGGLRSETRNGPALVFPTPVMTVYARPMERVLFWVDRDANPFLHFFECLYHMVGRNDLAYLEQFVSRMRLYSDDGTTLHGAYGYRWKRHFLRPSNALSPLNQINEVIDLLRYKPGSRRGVITMWDPGVDLWSVEEGHKDICCNTQIYVARSSKNRLDMTVLCRSNDIIFGAYGVNAVVFSFLQEYIASMLCIQVGTLYQLSNNYHAYLDVVEKMPNIQLSAKYYNALSSHCPYTRGEVRPYPIMNDPGTWDSDLRTFFINESSAVPCKYTNPFFSNVAVPLAEAHKAYRSKDADRFDKARMHIGECGARDWRRACYEWVCRREAVANAKVA